MSRIENKKYFSFLASQVRKDQIQGVSERHGLGTKVDMETGRNLQNPGQTYFDQLKKKHSWLEVRN